MALLFCAGVAEALEPVAVDRDGKAWPSGRHHHHRDTEEEEKIKCGSRVQTLVTTETQRAQRRKMKMHIYHHPVDPVDPVDIDRTTGRQDTKVTKNKNSWRLGALVVNGFVFEWTHEQRCGQTLVRGDAPCRPPCRNNALSKNPSSVAVIRGQTAL